MNNSDKILVILKEKLSISQFKTSYKWTGIYASICCSYEVYVHIAWSQRQRKITEKWHHFKKRKSDRMWRHPLMNGTYWQHCWGSRGRGKGMSVTEGTEWRKVVNPPTQCWNPAEYIKWKRGRSGSSETEDLFSLLTITCFSLLQRDRLNIYLLI